MKNDQEFRFLDKPETLETVSLLYTKWKGTNGNESDSSVLITYGCCLTPAFDQQQREEFPNWHEGKKRFNELLNEYRNKGFKSREELGIKTVGNFHDEITLNFKLQLWNLYLEVIKNRMDFVRIVCRNSLDL